MKNLISFFIGVITIAPILGYILVFTLTKWITGTQRKAKGYALNITTIVLIFSVHFLIVTIWSKSFFGWIILFMLIIGILFSFMYWKIKQEINYPKVLIGYWRFNFLLFSFAYIILLFYGVVKSAIEAIVV